MSTILITGGRVIDPSQSLDRVTNLLVKDGKIAGFDIPDEGKFPTYRAESKIVAPGFVDMHVELCEPGREEDETIAGERYQRFRVVAKITKFFDVTRFPCDEHLMTIAVELPGHQRSEVLFVADQEGSSVSSRVKVPAYNMKPAVVLEKPHSYKTARGDPRLKEGARSTYSQLRMGVGIERAGWGLYFKLFQSLYIAILLALLAFFIRPTEVDPRFGLGVGALFAGVANAYVISSLVPDTGVLALADIVNGVGIAVILLSVIQSAISLHLFTIRNAEAVSRAFDRISFAIILPGYVLLNLALPFGAISR